MCSSIKKVFLWFGMTVMLDTSDYPELLHYVISVLICSHQSGRTTLIVTHSINEY